MIACKTVQPTAAHTKNKTIEQSGTFRKKLKTYLQQRLSTTTLRSSQRSTATLTDAHKTD